MKIQLFLLNILLVIAGTMKGAAEPVAREQKAAPAPLGEFVRYPEMQREEWIGLTAQGLSDADLAKWAAASPELHAILQPILDKRKINLSDYWSSKQISFTPLNGHTQPVLSLSFSPDGTLLASGSEVIRLWNLLTGVFLEQLRGCAYGFDAVKFSPDGSLLAGFNEGSIMRWTIHQEKKEKKGMSLRIRNLQTSYGDGSLAFSPNGRLLAAGVGVFGTLTLFDAQTGNEKGSWQLSPNQNNITFAKNGSTILTSESGSCDWSKRSDYFHKRSHFIELININAGEIEKRFLMPEGGADSLFGTQISSAIFSHDQKILAMGLVGGLVVLWDVATGKEIKRLKKESEEYITALAFTGDSTTLAAGSNGGIISIWNVETGERINRFIIRSTPMEHQGVTALLFSPNGQTLASGASNGAIQLWKANQ